MSNLIASTGTPAETFAPRSELTTDARITGLAKEKATTSVPCLCIVASASLCCQSVLCLSIF
jgi:hypothetical protein